MSLGHMVVCIECPISATVLGAIVVLLVFLLLFIPRGT